MKISIIGAGNVGGLTAMHLARQGLKNIVLLDKAPGIAKGKALDLEDACAVLKSDYHIEGTDEPAQIKDSDIIVITAGLARKPGMSREELLAKNSEILKDIVLNIKKLASSAVVITVTNPLDLMTYLAFRLSSFKPNKVFGMGVSLDAGRFTNFISKELNVPNSEIQAQVVACHGEGMLPLPRLTTVKGVGLDKLLDDKKIQGLVNRTINRGAQIVSCLGSGSAYFAPSQAIAEIIMAIIKDEKRILGVSAYLNGEYGLRDICIGVPCCIGESGVEKIIELDLNKQEREALVKSAEALRKSLKLLEAYF